MVKKALAVGVPKATILTHFYPEVTVEKMSSLVLEYIGRSSKCYHIGTGNVVYCAYVKKNVFYKSELTELFERGMLLVRRARRWALRKLICKI